MALVEINEPNNSTESAVNILLALRKRLSLRFLGEYKPFPKLFYKRCKEHGYSFWTNENECNIEDYIRWVLLWIGLEFRNLLNERWQHLKCAFQFITMHTINDNLWESNVLMLLFRFICLVFRFMPNVSEAEKCTDNKKYIETAFGVLSNMPLMNNHSASWEILVSKRNITEFNNEGALATHIPVTTITPNIAIASFLSLESNNLSAWFHYFQVLFRIHHSLGDGVALLRLFLETIADRETSKKNLWTQCKQARQKLKTYFENEFTPPTFEQKFSIWKSMAAMNAREFQRIWNRFKLYINNLGKKIVILFLSPASIIHQGCFKKIDENTLHQQKLTGEKVSEQYFSFIRSKFSFIYFSQELQLFFIKLVSSWFFSVE